MIEMKDRPLFYIELPILFNTDMVRRVLDGEKTQTIRPLKPQPPGYIDQVGWTFFTGDRQYSMRSHSRPGEEYFARQPYCTGDRLYVRETWALGDDTEIVYRADGWDGKNISYSDWKPSIYMPKKHARIWLTVTDVSVMRIRDIEFDPEWAWDEGIERVKRKRSIINTPHFYEDPIPEFIQLWNGIYAAKGLGWDANPWCWRIKFEVE